MKGKASKCATIEEIKKKIFYRIESLGIGIIAVAAFALGRSSIELKVNAELDGAIIAIHDRRSTIELKGDLGFLS